MSTKAFFIANPASASLVVSHFSSLARLYFESTILQVIVDFGCCFCCLVGFKK
jgi:hypothetical protein